MSLNIDLSNIKNNTTEIKEKKEEVKPNSLALNLESVAEIEEKKEIISEFQLESEDLDRIIAAIGAGLATESVINARYLDENLLVEGRGLVKTVVRQGKLVKKNICPEGFKVTKSGMCERMTSKDMIAFKKRAMKAAKTRARKKPTAASIRMRNRSMLVRGKNAGRLNKVSPAPAHTQVG